MKLLLLIFAIIPTLCGAAMPIVVGGNIAAMNAARQANIAGSESRMTPVCLWQIPKQLQWINIGALQTMTVYNEGFGKTFSFHLRFGYQNSIEVEIAPGSDVMELPRSIKKQIAACAKGE